MTLGQRLSRRRSDKGWTQQELSDASGVRQSRISEIEADKHPDVSLRLIKRLALALGLTVDQLVEGDSYDGRRPSEVGVSGIVTTPERS